VGQDILVTHEFESPIAQTLSIVVFFSAAGIHHRWEKEKKEKRGKEKDTMKKESEEVEEK
jgi:hypothetical protein